MEDLKRIERSALSRASRAKSREDLAQIRADVLGKKGALGLAMQGLGKLPAAERPKVGQEVNKIKAKIEAALDAATSRVSDLEQKAELDAGRFDVTLPGRRVVPGAPHPLRLVEREVVRALMTLGFTV